MMDSVHLQKQFDSSDIAGHRTQFLQSLFTYHENEKMVKSDKNKVACKYNHRNMS